MLEKNGKNKSGQTVTNKEVLRRVDEKSILNTQQTRLNTS